MFTLDNHVAWHEQYWAFPLQCNHITTSTHNGENASQRCTDRLDDCGSITPARVCTLGSSSHWIRYVGGVEKGSVCLPNTQCFPGPLYIGLSVIIYNFIGISDFNQNFQVNAYLVQKWIDPRIKAELVPSLLARAKNGPVSKIILTDKQHIERFWLPETILLDQIEVSLVGGLEPSLLLTIDQHGQMVYTQRVNALLRCYMNIQNYPHDHQYCRVKVASREFENWRILSKFNSRI